MWRQGASVGDEYLRWYWELLRAFSKKELPVLTAHVGEIGRRPPALVFCIVSCVVGRWVGPRGLGLVANGQMHFEALVMVALQGHVAGCVAAYALEFRYWYSRIFLPFVRDYMHYVFWSLGAGPNTEVC